MTHASDVNNPATALSDRCARNGEPTVPVEPAVPVAAIKWFGEALEAAVKRPVEASGYTCEPRARVGSVRQDGHVLWCGALGARFLRVGVCGECE